ncbi:zf-DHHC-domain-containing protein [Violaceomyces palustris]|uniref:Zf-DHHC-domain-containing protein n=1 Tax=Violaceomyces palustris TaxID=1673888 RepID=A0ACD0NX69_9BASI|nr:zf-DHHC-domain-containing protein [Violaceomyces palustris]
MTKITCDPNSPAASPRLKSFCSKVAYVPFVFILGLILYAWFTLAVTLAIQHNMVRHTDYSKGLVQLVISTLLAAGAASSFIVAVNKNPGVPIASPEALEARAGYSQNYDHPPTSGNAVLSDNSQSRNRTGGGRRRSHHPASASQGAATTDYEMGLKGNRKQSQEEEGFVYASQDESQDDYDDDDDDYDDDDHAGSHSAPLLPSTIPIPGQPQLPARTGRQQLKDAYLTGRTSKVELRNTSNLWVKSSGEDRWCAKCKAPKPDRCHHCSSCGRCVLRMDHHCPWLASKCVGLRNHKAFFLFISYTALFCAYSCQEMIRALLHYVENEDNGFETTPIGWAVVLFLGFIFGASLIPFSGYHAYLICRNRTTIESMEGSGRVRLRARPDPRRERVEDRLKRLASDRMGGPALRTSHEADGSSSSGAPVRPKRGSGELPTWRSDEYLTKEERKALRRANKLNVYDIGVSANWRQVMGPKWWLWFVPIGDPQGDGFSYLVNSKTLRELEEVTARVRIAEARADQERRGEGRAGGSRRAGDTGSGSRDRFVGAHGEVEWGQAPRKSEWGVLYGIGEDEDAQGEGALGHSGGEN